jgi:hypothetical protein
VEADREVLLAEKKEALAERTDKKDKQDEKEVVVEPPTDEELRQLAQNRADLVKDILVNRHGIDHERLYLCLPEIVETPKAEPVVELLVD